MRRVCAIIILLLSLAGCSSPDSQERLNILLCWLRPSCLPQERTSSSPPFPSPQARPSSPVPPAKQSSPSSPPSVPVPSETLPRCQTSAQATFTAKKPYVTVSYTEPTTKANGQPLTNLAKTTIYHDLGKGLTKFKDVPASSPEGGGVVSEKITLDLKEGEVLQGRICVTATDTNGREG